MGFTIAKRVVQVSLTADEWELYDKPERDQAAFELSQALETAINNNAKALDAYKEAMPVFRKWSEMGAVDSEPLAYMNGMLSKAYPGEWD